LIKIVHLELKFWKFKEGWEKLRNPLEISFLPRAIFFKVISVLDSWDEKVSENKLDNFSLLLSFRSECKLFFIGFQDDSSNNFELHRYFFWLFKN